MLKGYRVTSFVGLFVILFTFSCIDLEPDTDTTPIGKDHTITATALGEGSVPLEGILVTFEIISGPNIGRVSIPNSGECFPIDCTTNDIGEVTWTYSSSFAGTELITGTFLDMEGFPIISEPVESIWAEPIPSLTEWGFVALAVALGAIGIFAVRRRKVAV